MAETVAVATFRTHHGHSASDKGGWVSDVWMIHKPVEGGTHQLDLVWHQHKWAGRLWAARLTLKSWIGERRGRPVCWCQRAKLRTYPAAFSRWDPHVRTETA